ncbi:MAG: putative porin [Deltaproteobacteria bacterium]|nr:putative porin [Deltaproteobacteria bacterium]
MQIRKKVATTLCAGGILLGLWGATPAYAQKRSVAEELIEVLEADGKLSKSKAEELRQRAKVENEAREAGVEAFRREPVKAIKADKDFDWLNRLSFFGDLRTRGEGFYQDQGSLGNGRTRLRIRLRLGMRARISDELEGVLRIASGTANDPISTNQSLDNLFNKKPINLDQAYLTFSPGQSFGLGGWEWKPLTISAGKMPVTLWRPRANMLSEMIFDDDLTPEGLAETFTPYQATEGFVRRFQINAVQWLAREQARSAESMIWGGQLVGAFSLLPSTNLTLAVGDYYFSHDAVLAKERTTNSDLKLTNGVILKNGAVVRGGASFSPSSTNPIRDFASGFNIFNVGAQVDYNTGYPRWPLTFFVDYAKNTLAYNNEDTAIWGGVSLGTLRNPGDFAFSAVYARTETESLMSYFTYSDFGRDGGTNVQGPFVKFDYLLLPRLTLTAKNHFVSFIDRQRGQSNSMLNRLQLDAQLAF